MIKFDNLWWDRFIQFPLLHLSKFLFYTVTEIAKLDYKVPSVERYIGLNKGNDLLKNGHKGNDLPKTI